MVLLLDICFSGDMVLNKEEDESNKVQEMYQRETNSVSHLKSLPILCTFWQTFGRSLSCILIHSA